MKDSTPKTITDLKERFKSNFSSDPEKLVKAPGRVNLIGEYTDLNQGFVLPMAIDRYLMAAVSRTKGQKIRVHSMDYNETIYIDLNNIKKSEHAWSNYISGCLWILQEAGYELRGFDCVTAGNIPVGAGLSSSAALELAILKAATWSADIEWDEVQMAKLGQKVENQWIGVQSGIMDQIIISAGKKEKALMIDCRDLSFESCPLPEKITIAILDTSTRRGLVDSQYNIRKDQCFKAAETLKVDFLRDADLSMLDAVSNQLAESVYKRAKHVITENERVKIFAQSMKSEDIEKMGNLMQQSHRSLKDDFEVTNDALNIMVDFANAHQACFGARMTGAGFGGCAVALIKKGSERSFIKQVSESYKSKTEIEPKLYACKASAGVTIESFPGNHKESK